MRQRRVIVPTARINDGGITVRRSRSVGGQWERYDVPVENKFAADIWSIVHGSHAWGVDANGKGLLEANLVPYDQPLPEIPIDGKPVIVMPIHSAEFEGKAELVIDDKAASETLSEFLSEATTWDECHSEAPIMIPLVTTSGVETEIGMIAVIEIESWIERPIRWGKPLLLPTPKS